MTTPRGDSVRIPLFKSSSLGDSVWAIPLVVFWHAVLQEPVMPLGSWKVEAQVYHTREANPSEVALHSTAALIYPTLGWRLVELQGAKLAPTTPPAAPCSQPPGLALAFWPTPP